MGLLTGNNWSKDNYDVLDNLIESGSNANGNWVRFSDGTQICWQHTTRDGVAMTQAYGNGLFREPATTIWNYPASFVAIPYSNVTANYNAPYTYVNERYIADVSYRCATVTNTTRDGVPLFFIAIGRWK